MFSFSILPLHVHTYTQAHPAAVSVFDLALFFSAGGNGLITLAEMKGPSRAPSKGCTHGSSRCLLCGANKHTWRPSGAIRDRQERAKGGLGRAWGSISCVGLLLLQHDESKYFKLSKMNEWWGKKSGWCEVCMTWNRLSIRKMVYGLSDGQPLATSSVTRRHGLSAGLAYYLFISPNSWHLVIIVQER